MNRDVLAGNWKQLRGEIRARWGELTDDELDQAQGNLEKLAGLIQERYGLAKDQARKQLDALAERFASMKPAHAEEKPAARKPPMKAPMESPEHPGSMKPEEELEPSEVHR